MQERETTVSEVAKPAFHRPTRIADCHFRLQLRDDQPCLWNSQTIEAHSHRAFGAGLRLFGLPAERQFENPALLLIACNGVPDSRRMPKSFQARSAGRAHLLNELNAFKGR